MAKRDSVNYSDDEMEAIIGSISRRAKTGIRDRAAIYVMWRGMLRISECLALRPADIDMKTGEVRVLHGKGDKSRTVALPPSAMDAMEKWMDVRKTLPITKDSPIFCSLYGKRVDASHFRHKLPRLADRLKFGKRLHPHGFRHSGAVKLMKRGAPLGVISKALGHSSLRTTEIYLNHHNPAEVIAAMQEE